jgi:putative ABC transport system substrate-binding protein
MSEMMRREFITLLGGGAVAWPSVILAQQPIPVIGYLGNAKPAATSMTAFRQGLSEADYVEGQNLTIEFRWVDGQYDRYPDLAADLVRRQVSVIVTTGGITPVRAALGATSKIPIVFLVGVDPVREGLVVSMNRPGGNLTGVTTLNAELGPKRLELIHELVPTASLIAVLVNPANLLAEPLLRDLEVAGRRMGIQIHALQASTEGELDAAFAGLRQLQAGALMIGTDPFLNAQSKQLGALAARYAIPTIYQYREFAAAGGLMSYGMVNLTDPNRLVGAYAGRILKGEKPSDLPVQQPTKIELIVNLKTAKALGLEVPPTLLARADEVIE